jgi:MOSC domain-containing protein YiiM
MTHWTVTPEVSAASLKRMERTMMIAADIRIQHLYYSPGHNFYGHHGKPPDRHAMVECRELQCVAGRGIVGDRFFDHQPDYCGQITFFSHEVYGILGRELGISDKAPSVFRRNVITAGIDLNTLIGAEFQIQNVRFHGTEECRPCHWMNRAFADGAEKLLQHRGGLRAIILSDGPLRIDAP